MDFLADSLFALCMIILFWVLISLVIGINLFSGKDSNHDPKSSGEIWKFLAKKRQNTGLKKTEIFLEVFGH